MAKLTPEEALARQRKFIVPAVALYYDHPLLLVRAEGTHLIDAQGKRYLDFYAGILTVSVGYNHPQVKAAVASQLDEANHLSTFYLTAPMIELAERLAAITPGALEMSFFTNSGTEANESALHMARLATHRQEVVALRYAYSGHSTVTRSLTGLASWRPTVEVPGIRHAHAPYCYRCPFHRTPDTCNYECAKDVEEVIRTTTSGQIAAFIAEPIQGAGGFITPPEQYFQIVHEIIKRYGGLFIADEVQTGFGRTGKMFGIEHWGVNPDLMTFAKALANGAPIGATVAIREVGEAFTGPVISTFGGNPISMRAAVATLDVIEDEGLVERARVRGEALRQGLDDLKARYSFVGDVRGKGLMQAIEFVRAEKAPAPDLLKEFMEGTRRRGVLVGKGGIDGQVARISPPLTITDSELKEALTAMAESLADIALAHPELRPTA